MIAGELIKFIDKCPSAFHVIKNVQDDLVSHGFIELFENEEWSLKLGTQYFVRRNASTLIAFTIPNNIISGFNIVASHSDAPCFKVKGAPEIDVDKQYVQINTEKYGGMLMAPWLDRPLSVAGRASVRTENGIRNILVNVDRDLLLIPNLAIHMNRKANEGYTYNAQKDMLPLYGMEGCKKLNSIIAKEIGVEASNIYASDLFLYNRNKGTIWGADNEFVSAPRLDDLQCVFSSVKALLQASNNTRINMTCIFDNEETGSSSKQGADSDFLYDVMKRICLCNNMDEQKFMMLISDSFMLSADNAHAVHPNHPDKADPTNRPYLNGGIVIKQNAAQKYTTDSTSEAVFKLICKNAGIPVQSYVNRSDILGGSTLGNISNTHVSLNTVDIGAPQLAMHSPYETTGVKDTEYLLSGMTAFYNSDVKYEANMYFIKKA